MPRWKYVRSDPPPSATGGSCHPAIEAILIDRGCVTEEDRARFVSPDFLRDTYDPFLFGQMSRVVERLGQALQSGETVGLFGDYDADGVTSSVVMREALEGLGIPVVVYIPEKLSEGHGFNLSAVDFFEAKGAKLVLTLDCGMTNHEEIRVARKRGMDTIIVDHHHVPETLPEAFAIVNPKLPDETYPFRELCGAGASFKVAQALYRRWRPEQEEQLKWLLDIVAVGTVADVMPLIGENRTFVKYGLIVLSKTRRLGLREMYAVSRQPVHEHRLPDARMVGFHIAPRINAASRMAHAMLAYALLVEADPVRARMLALELEAHNTARQKVSADTTTLVRTLALEGFAEKKFIFAVSEHYPFGIVGLVAGRIANEFRKPTCVLTRGAETSQGSFRSIPELNIIETLGQCADLLVKFGGHSQAAGMTISNEHLETFAERFGALVEEKLRNVDTEPVLSVDMPLRSGHINRQFVEELSRLAPFGEGNPEPVFVLKNARVENARLVGNGGKHWKMTLSDGEGTQRFESIGFALGETYPDIAIGDRLDVAFHLNENTWNGATTIQLKLLDIRRR